jgi:hypothetical protein
VKPYTPPDGPRLCANRRRTVLLPIYHTHLRNAPRRRDARLPPSCRDKKCLGGTVRCGSGAMSAVVCDRGSP